MKHIKKIILLILVIIILCIYFGARRIKENFARVSIDNSYQYGSFSMREVRITGSIYNGHYYYLGIGNKYISYDENTGKIRLESLRGNVINYDKLFVIRYENGFGYQYSFKHIYGPYLCAKTNDYIINNNNHNRVSDDYELIGLTNNRNISYRNYINNNTIFYIENDTFKIYIKENVNGRERNFYIKNIGDKLTLSSDNGSNFNIQYIDIENGLLPSMECLFKSSSNNVIRYNNFQLVPGEININGNLIHNYILYDGGDISKNYANNLQFKVNNRTYDNLNSLAIENGSNVTDDTSIKTIKSRLYFHIKSNVFNTYIGVKRFKNKYILTGGKTKRDAEKFFFRKENFDSTGHFVNVLCVVYRNREYPISLANQPHEITGNYEEQNLYLRDNEAIRHCFIPSYDNLSSVIIGLKSGYSEKHSAHNDKVLFLSAREDGDIGTQTYLKNGNPWEMFKFEMLDDCKNTETIKYELYVPVEIDSNYSRIHPTFINSTYTCKELFVTRNRFRNSITRNNNKYISSLKIEIKPEVHRDNIVLYTGKNYTGMFMLIPVTRNHENINLNILNKMIQDNGTWPVKDINDKIQSIKLPTNNSGINITIYEHENYKGASMKIENDISDLGNFNRKISSLSYINRELRNSIDRDYIIFYSNKNFTGMFFIVQLSDIKEDNGLSINLNNLNRIARMNPFWDNNVSNDVNDVIQSIKMPRIRDNNVYILQIFEHDNYEGKGYNLMNSIEDLSTINFFNKISSIKIEKYISSITDTSRNARARKNMANGRSCPDICMDKNITGDNYLSSSRGQISKDGLNFDDTENICGGFLDNNKKCINPNETNIANEIRNGKNLVDCRGCQIDFYQKRTEAGSNMFCPDKCYDGVKVDNGPDMRLYTSDDADNRKGFCEDKINVINNNCVNNNMVEQGNMSIYNCENCVDDRDDKRFEPFQNIYGGNDVNVLARITTVQGDRIYIRREYIASLFDEYLYNTNSNIYGIKGQPYIKSIKNTTSNKLIGLYYNVLESPLTTRISIITTKNIPINLNKVEIYDEYGENIAIIGSVIINGIDDTKLVPFNRNSSDVGTLTSLLQSSGGIKTISEEGLVLNFHLMHRSKISKIKIIGDNDTIFDGLRVNIYSGSIITRMEQLSNGQIQSSTRTRMIELTLSSQGDNIITQQPFGRMSYPYNVGKFVDRVKRPNFILGPQDEIDLETGTVNISSREIISEDERNLNGYYGMIKTTSVSNPQGTNVNGIVIENVPKECKYFNNDQRDCENIKNNMGNISLGNGVSNININRLENGNVCRFVDKQYLQPSENRPEFMYNNEIEKNFQPTNAELGLYGVHPKDSIYGDYSPIHNNNDNSEIKGLCFSTMNNRAPKNGICTGNNGNMDPQCISKIIDNERYARHKDAQLIELGYINKIVPRTSDLRSSQNAVSVSRRLSDINRTLNGEIERRNINTARKIKEIKCKYCMKACDIVRNGTGGVELIKNCNCETIGVDCKDVNVNKEIENFSNENDDKIKRFESNYLNQSISVNDIGSKDLYTINMNRKCLTSYGDKNYKLSECNGNKSQQFLKKQINNRYDAKYFTNKETTPQRNVTYPYNFLKSKTSDNCLQFNNDGISIEPCNPDNYKQHWKGYTSEKTCMHER